MNVIEVNNLVKSYKDFIAVDGVSFSVEEGTIFGMLGPNGAGKSTTIESVIGLKNRDGGSVKILGMDPLKEGKKLFEYVGVQLQETSYQDKIRVNELCELFMNMYDHPVDYKILLKKFGLEDKEKVFVSQLSGGQRQKIAIILALIPDPKIIFLDELTTGLDPKSRREMWEVVKGLRDEGKTIFMTTHYMEEATYLCDQICIIEAGKIIALDSVEGIINKGNIDFEIAFKLKKENKEIVTIITDEIKDINHIVVENKTVKIKAFEENVISKLILLLDRLGIDFHQFNINRADLEDAYLKLTGKAWKETA